MKLTAEKIMSAYQVLLGVMKEKRDDRFHLPTKAAYRVARMVTILEPEHQALMKIRVEMVKRLGKYDSAKDVWSVLPENAEEFTREWGTVLAEEIEVSCQPIPLEQLGDGPSYFTVPELLLLKDLIKEG